MDFFNKKLAVLVILLILCLVKIPSVRGETTEEPSPIPNAGFEMGDLSGWRTYCYPAGSNCKTWSATVGSAYAYDGNYGLRLYNANNYWWSSAYLGVVNRFINDYDVYTIPMKLAGGAGKYWSGVIVTIYDTKGYVRYRGNAYGSIYYAPPDEYFLMTKGEWKVYSFDFKADYYKKYGRYPNDNRSLNIVAYQDTDYSDVYIDNVFGYPCTDFDLDGYAMEGGKCGLADCNDNDASISPGALEICDGIDNNCNGEIDEGGNSLCDDGLFCNGEEICEGSAGCVAGTPPNVDDGINCTVDSCDEINDVILNVPDDTICDNGLFCDGLESCNPSLGCQPGTPISCHQFDIEEINTCFYDPDNNPFTLDYFEGFTSVCDEEIDACTTGTVDLTHTCNIEQCGAECETDNDCAPTECDNLDNCYEGTYRDYQDVENTCTEGCLCTINGCSVYIEVITDKDGDGFDIECDDDCDDSDATVYPGAPELCDSKDNNCDGKVDENCPITLKQDSISLLEDAKNSKGTKHKIKIVNKLIDRIIRNIKNSLKKEYWKDELRLNSEDGKNNGMHVFGYELKAAILCRTRGAFHKNLRQVCKKVKGNLVEADEQLAQTSIDDAENTEVANENNQKCYNIMLKVARKMMKRAEQKKGKLPEASIINYMNAWKFSQKAIGFAESSEDICNYHNFHHGFRKIGPK